MIEQQVALVVVELNAFGSVGIVAQDGKAHGLKRVNRTIFFTDVGVAGAGSTHNLVKLFSIFTNRYETEAVLMPSRKNGALVF